MNIARLLLGRRLANREGAERKIGAFEGVPAMGLDSLGSSSYGPEAALAVMVPLGAAGLGVLGPVMAAIVALLAILYLSYRQTIAAYPSNGGAFTVARENLGTHASLLAAAALMIDYVLNVAVGISAGVGALTSAIPALHPWTLSLCLGILVLITLINLRGTMDAGRVFALPTYLFLGSFALLLGMGLFGLLSGGGAPEPVEAPPPLPEATAPVGWWLVLHAFASGCTAMTGVEAVSNGMGAFREPAVKYGRRTLAVLCAALGLLLIGIATLVTAYGIGAMDQEQEGYQSVMSQLAAAVAGRGWLYYTAIGSLLCVLALSAETSFTGFPRLCRTVAEDGFLPRAFAVAGRRLVFSVGVLYLAATAGLLLVVFGGITERLIPLFAIGAFLTFTLSQAGMVVHWRRRLAGPDAQRGDRLRLTVNAAGALTTGLALIIIMVAKFTEGAWITLLAVPAAIALLKLVRRYYDRMEAWQRTAGPLRPGRREPPVVIVATAGRSRLSDEALRFALELSPDVVAVHLTALEGEEESSQVKALREAWQQEIEAPAAAEGLRPPRLVVLPATYRRVEEPLLELIEGMRPKIPGRRVAILVPELVKRHWYQHLLHTHQARRLRARLLKRGKPDIVVISVPWDPAAEAESQPAGEVTRPAP
jgi:amino acid transporter